MSFSESFLDSPLAPPSWQGPVCQIKSQAEPAWFRILHQDDDAAKQNKKHARSLAWEAWATSKVDQHLLRDTWKLNSPPKSIFAKVGHLPSDFRNLRVLLVSYGEIKQFKPSDSSEESGRFEASGELW